jgi:hypothetical protein
LPSGILVPSQVDHAETAFAQNPLDPVATDALRVPGCKLVWRIPVRRDGRI